MCGIRCGQAEGGKGRFHDLGIEIFCFYQWEKEERIDRSAEADNRRPTL